MCVACGTMTLGLMTFAMKCLTSSVCIKCMACAVIQSLVALVHEPEPEHPLRGDLAEEYTKDRKKFMKNAEEYTKKLAEKRPSD